MSKLNDILQKVDAQKSKNTNATADMLKNNELLLDKKYDFLSNSLAFSNIIISKEEVKALLLSNDMISSDTKKDKKSDSSDCASRIIIGYSKAFDFMLELSKQQPLAITEDAIKHFHHLLYSELEQSPADTYRMSNFIEKETGYRSPSFEDLPHVMAHLADQYRSSCTTLHPVELSAMMSKRVLDIHPFTEGNEAIAHLVMNLILLYYGYDMVTLPVSKQEAYRLAIHIARTEYDMDPLCIFLAELLLEN